ncbi:MAG: Smr/MutS family protein [Robiginitomaculum sp.]|nr:Smr/MutS family protein [Robiginitomaculum sp.]
MKGSRQLTDADQQIWRRISRTVRPLNVPKTSSNPGAKTETHIHLPVAPAPILHHSRQDIQIRADKKTRRGQVKIDRTIDLHDMSRDAAFASLKRRLVLAHECNHRTVLIITGKGPNLQGILRQSLQGWLNDPSLRHIIASIAQAHIRHGGTGAFYVFLKRLG